MNTAKPVEQLVFSAAEVALALGVTPYDLYQKHPAYFGVPGHWAPVKTGGTVYTVAGARGLRDVFKADGKHEEADALEVIVKAREVEWQQAHATPSRELVTPAPKSSEPYYRKGDLA